MDAAGDKPEVFGDCLVDSCLETVLSHPGSEPLALVK
jgi:hypothetical protein